MRRITGKTTSAGGLAVLLLVSMAAGCGSTRKTTADTVPVRTVPGTTVPVGPVPVGAGSTVSPTTVKPQPTLASQYEADMVALTTSPAWAIVEAQVAPQNTYMTNFSGNAPTVTGAQLAAVTAEIRSVSSELQTLSHDDQSNLASANIDADTQIEDVSIDLSNIPNDVSTGINVADDINMVHGADVQARTSLDLPLTGSGAVAAVPVASS